MRKLAPKQKYDCVLCGVASANDQVRTPIGELCPSCHAKPESKELNKVTFRAWAQAAIRKYVEQDKIVDAMVWSQIIGFYNAALNKPAESNVEPKEGDK